MTKGDAGQNISKFASSSSAASPISTRMPYVSYRTLALWLKAIYEKTVEAVDLYFKAVPDVGSRSAAEFKTFCDGGEWFESV